MTDNEIAASEATVTEIASPRASSALCRQMDSPALLCGPTESPALCAPMEELATAGQPILLYGTWTEGGKVNPSGERSASMTRSRAMETSMSWSASLRAT